MPNRPLITLPQAATDHMSTIGQQQLPSNISPAVHIVHDDASIQFQLYTGTTGVTDVFVFDLSQYQGNSVDAIDNFEADRDVIAFINAPSDFTYENVTNVAMIKGFPPTDDDPSIVNSLASAYTDFRSVDAYVFDTLSTNTSFSATNLVHLTDGTTILV
ncbi:hypothetical protein NLM16_00235 [Bradyrhizobium brasilense]|uniref:hypothetical protein n=1 Tax=Bradyrhizobium brasilense TaxID=1419277 RepID=UPI002877549E|nr:hypothetical protein [Bradyrhizobium brasilense]MCP3412525.1 hypothetical protein [Bradyrhizobium brasilense]